MSKILQAHLAIYEILKTRPAFSAASVNFNEALPAEPPTEPWLNVVLAPGRAEVLAEVLGLGEANVTTEFAQVFHLEWVVRREDPVIRQTIFAEGLAAIEAALHADRTLSGAVRGLTIGPADFTNHRYAFIPTTAAANVPVRVLLSGASPIS